MIESQPVEVTNEDPLPVRVSADGDTEYQSEAKKIAASAGVDADILQTEDQRRISGMWERTQQLIALSVVWVTLFAALVKTMEATLTGQDSKEAGVAFVFLASVANLVIGFYFGRTNHQRVGGDTKTR